MPFSVKASKCFWSVFYRTVRNLFFDAFSVDRLSRLRTRGRRRNFKLAAHSNVFCTAAASGAKRLHESSASASDKSMEIFREVLISFSCFLGVDGELICAELSMPFRPSGTNVLNRQSVDQFIWCLGGSDRRAASAGVQE